MGCDIHPVVEYRRDNGNWQTMASDIEIPRNYSLFGAMVEGHTRSRDVPGVAPERGLPDEPRSWLVGAFARELEKPSTLGARVDLGDHTFSWLHPSEFREAVTRVSRHFDYEPDVSTVALIAMLDTLAEAVGDENVRLVFGFDN